MKEFPRLLIADKNNIYDVPFLQATGMKAGKHFPLEPSDLIKLHPDSELFMLPERSPVAFDPETGEYARLDHDPFRKKKKSLSKPKFRTIFFLLKCFLHNVLMSFFAC